METFEKAKIAIKALDSKKGYNIKVFKIDDLTILGDYFIFATGSSSTQVRALADEVDEKMSENGIEPNHIEGKSSGWILLDYGDVIIHIMDAKNRDFYALEHTWNDGTDIPLEEILK